MAAEQVSQALSALEAARKRIRDSVNRQIRGNRDREAIRVLALDWFQVRRPAMVAVVTPEVLAPVDSAYHEVLAASEHNSAKSTYLKLFAQAKNALIDLRAAVVLPQSRASLEPAPDFTPLASDEAMQAILRRRWDECQKCVAAGAPLAAVVMMGGLLEALFVARANKLVNKSSLFHSLSTPKDTQTKKALDLRDWTLRNYLDVGHELKWISRSGKDVGAVLRDYRNYVHPEKERSHQVIILSEDGTMFWEVTKALVRQVLSLS